MSQSITKRINGMHKAETERTRRAWESYYEEAFRDLSDEVIAAYLQVADLTDEESNALVAQHIDVFEPLTPDLQEWLSESCPLLPGDNDAVHYPDVLPVPPPEPERLFDQYRAAFDEADEQGRYALSWVLVVLGLARATRHFQLEAK